MKRIAIFLNGKGTAFGAIASWQPYCFGHAACELKAPQGWRSPKPGGKSNSSWKIWKSFQTEL